MENDAQSQLNTSSKETELIKPVVLPENDSRLEKHLQKSAKKNILLVVGGLLLLGIFLFFFGVPLLVGFSSLVGSFQQKTTQPILQEEIFIAPPTLSIPFEATRSAQIAIAGNASENDLTIELYINGNRVDSTAVKKDGTFSFPTINLEKGGNIIKAKAVNKKNIQSSFSEPFVVTYNDNAPELEITAPQDGQTIKKDASPLTVMGKTDVGNKVTINDFWAIVDGDGEFSYRLPLQDGDNKILVVSTNEAGNETKKEITIKVEN